MLTLDTAVQTAIEGNDIWTVRLIDLEVGGTTYRISDHYKSITVGANTYIGNGNLLAISNIKNAVRSDNDSIEINTISHRYFI